MAFQHKFHGNTNSLVFVHWFERFSRDMSSSLIFVNTSKTASHINPIVHISDLLKPLMHAYDEEEGKLWILNPPLLLTYLIFVVNDTTHIMWIIMYHHYHNVINMFVLSQFTLSSESNYTCVNFCKSTCRCVCTWSHAV